MAHFLCPYLGSNVELTGEREHHIANHHPDLLPDPRQCIADALADLTRSVEVPILAMHGCSVAGLNRYVAASMSSSLWSANPLLRSVTGLLQLISPENWQREETLNGNEPDISI